MKMAFAQMEIRKLTIPHTGKVKNQAAKSSNMIFLFVEPFLQSPMPIIAQVFACVVAVGIPKKEQTPRKEDDAVSAALLLSGSSVVISQPTFFIIFEPPKNVPAVIAIAHKSVIVIGILNSLSVLNVSTPINESPSIYTPMNFCESCAPCKNELIPALTR